MIPTASSDNPVRRTRFVRLVCLAVIPLLSGCSAFHPLHGIPSRLLPCEIRGPSRSGKRTIDLSLLRQTPADAYHIDAGDTLAVYIEGVLGQRTQPPPVHVPQQGAGPSSLGYPIPVRSNGTVSLPVIGSLNVRGMTVEQVETAVRQAYTIEHRVLQPGRDHILVSLQRPRTYRVLVIRQEAGNESISTSSAGTVNPGSVKRGTGRAVLLPAYKNDVLNALAETGGLPGLDAENTIYIIRQKRSRSSTTGPSLSPPPQPTPRNAPAGPAANAPATNSIRQTAGVRPVAAWEHGRQYPARSVVRTTAAVAAPLTAWQPDPNQWQSAATYGRYGGRSAVPSATGHVTPESSVPPAPAAAVAQSEPEPEQQAAFIQTDNPGTEYFDPTIANSNVVKIPIRLSPGELPRFTEQDIVLGDGDVVFIESRDTEIFYTGGLLGGGQYSLPRDYDLDVLGAISIAQSGNSGTTSSRSIGGVSAMNRDVTISASNVIILRQLPDGRQIPIKVKLERALRDPQERVIIQPGDYVILQYTIPEAIAAFVERHLLEGALFGLAASQVNGSRN